MEPILTQRRSVQQQYLLSVLLVFLVSGVCYLFSEYLEFRVVAFLLLVTVSVAAVLFDILPVLLAAVLSALVLDFFFVPPFFTFTIRSTDDALTLLMYFVVALVNAVLTYKIRQIEKIARQKEEREQQLQLYNVLLNSLSHELRTPIATIIGASDNLLEHSDKISDDNKRELLAEISKASLRLNRQVDNLLNMSRLESGFLEPKLDWFEPSELVYATLAQLEESLTKHRIVVALADNMPLVKLDFGLLQQALYNLVSNAAIYTPEGSTITIGASTDEKHLQLSVADNGLGFPEDEINSVFGKFYRLKNAKAGGTGLGLSIVKGIVEAHHGQITLSNQISGGAIFRMVLPTELSSLNQLDK